VGRSLTGSNPLAGPASAVAGAGFGGAGAPGAGSRPSGLAAASQGPDRRAPAGLPAAGSGRPARGAIGNPGGAIDYSVSKATVSYLEAHQGSARYLAAAVGSTTAGSLALQSARNVINMGGFMGSDPSPTLSQLKLLVNTGELHYVLLNSAGNGARMGAGFSTPATKERNRWVETHGKVVKIAGESNAAMTLYYLSSTA
jgi:hypothetical protein